MTNLENQFDFAGVKFSSLGQASGFLVGPMFELAAIAVVIYFLIGAFKYIISAGDKGQVEAARDMITHAIIGFLLLMVMFLVLQFIPEFFGLTGFKIIQ